MFHKFSAVPANADRQTEGSDRSKKNNNNVSDTDPNPSQAKRQKAARACDRCRLLRIKCYEQKPCAQCVSIKAKYVVSYAPLRSTRTKNIDTGHAPSESSTVTFPMLPSPSPTYAGCRDSSPTANPSPVSLNVPPSRVSMDTKTRTPKNAAAKEFFTIAHVQGFFASG